MMEIKKYFWDLNDKALIETKRILRDPQHPKFLARIVVLLSRCDQPKVLFSVLPREEFLKAWPKIRSYWRKLSRESDFRDWWETIFEQLLVHGSGNKTPKGDTSRVFAGIGRKIREVRLEKGLSQKQLALATGVKQPEISRIEEGKKNFTVKTLMTLCRELGIKNLELWPRAGQGIREGD